MDQVGGRLLGQGVYGCTFDPAPRCANKAVFSKISGLPAVGKITTEDGDSELKIGRAIMALPLASAYFALPTKHCAPQMPVQDSDAQSCEILTKAPSDSEFSMLIMPLAGRPLIKYGVDLDRLATNFKRIFIHLLEGALIYQNAGYVHNDIHLANILVDDMNVARYIDFGLAFKISDVKVWEDANLGTTFKPEYVWQAPEVHGLRMIKNGIRIEDGVQRLKEQNPEYRQMENRYPTRRSCVAALTDLFISYKGDSASFIRTYAKQFDAWRIGLSMWFLWDDLLQNPLFVKTGLYSERDLLRAVTGGLTDFDPRVRLTVAGALRMLDPGNRIAR
jgi:hypothetical protein